MNSVFESAFFGWLGENYLGLVNLVFFSSLCRFVAVKV